MKKLFVMLLLDPVEHSSDLDPWPWGGESIFRNDKFCGTVSCFLLTILLITHIPYLKANNDPNDENRLRQQAMDFLWENRSVSVLSKTLVEKMDNQFT